MTEPAYDYAVVGAGIVGSAIARVLAGYQQRVALIDARDDVGEGTSKANTAILHTGFDAKPHTRISTGCPWLPPAVGVRVQDRHPRRTHRGVLRKAVWAKGSSGPGVGAVREVTGYGFWLHEQITAYDAPRSCAYDVVDSFPASQHEGGRVTCTPSGDDTHVEWVTGYTVPARGGGKVVEVLTAPLISFNLRAILAGCAKALET